MEKIKDEIKDELKLNYFGIQGGQTGYGVHAQGLIKAMKSKGVNVVSGGIGLPTLAISMPESWQYLSGDRCKPFIPFLVSEGDKICALWKEMCELDYVTELFTPSTHTRDAIINSGIKKKVTIAPHGIDLSIWNPEVKPNKELSADTFRFFMLGGWGQGRIDRKGFQYALKAFSEEFKPSEPVELFFKINMAYNPQLNVNEEIYACGVSKETKLRIIPQDMPYDSLPSLYKSMDCFIAPTMADSFNIPVLEAMSVGLPVITTNYGGQTDFVDEGVGWLIPVERMIPSRGVPEIYYEGVNWAEPSVTKLRELMRYAYDHREECKSKGLRGVERVKDYTWDKTASTVLSKFNLLNL